ncbi:MAG: AmmeMemoRadiSam system radical SAM enzyme [Candidatus Pacebacteria bacterium]|nr:AmmeMemoRadiSam system radical SAM enzyme [Candidatus Paceibacterota bacterium]
MKKESYLYKKLENNKVQCSTCSHRCFILPEKYGICGVRKNINGKLYALNYGKAISSNIDPIEKKPLFHFLPKTNSFSIATVGCNLRCGNCQNWQISQLVKTDKNLLRIGQELTPKDIVQRAIENKCQSISYTYTEPTIFLEYALDTMKIAKKAGIKNIWVTNGFMSIETLKLIKPYLDAVNVDIKSFDDKFYIDICGAKVNPILENLKWMKKNKIWIETTTLIIPNFSDDEKMLKNIAKFIFKELGSETPWHISAFSGAISYKMQDIPNTPLQTIQKAYKIGKKSGLKYVYGGNISGTSMKNTYCPKCNELAIERVGFYVKKLDKQGKCAKCGKNLNIISN